MKIVGKHKDYYDSGAQFGYDENVTFVRNINYIEQFKAERSNEGYIKETRAKFNKKLNLPERSISISEGDAYNRNDPRFIVNYKPIYVWFAGTLILGYEIKEFRPNNDALPTYDMKRYYVYGDEMIEKIKYLENETISVRFKRSIDEMEYLVKDIEEALNSIKLINGFDIAKEHNTAYFLVYNHSAYDNTGTIVPTPSLTDIQFFKIKDYIQAWQEIESFIPSLKVEPISEMTDAQKIASHSMDETSFRCQAPGNKKEKRRRNKAKKRKNG